MAYGNTNSGVLFKNEKRKDDRSPTHEGSIDIDGTEFWLSAWVSEVKKTGSPRFGQKFFSLRVKPKEGSTPSSPMSTDFDDDIPFG